MDFCDLDDNDKIDEMIKTIEHRYKNDNLAKMLFPKTQLTMDEIKIFSKSLIDYIYMIMRTPHIPIDNVYRGADYIIGNSIEHLIHSIKIKLNKSSIILFYNLELDSKLDISGKKVYRCRLVIYDDIKNRRNIKLNKILNG